MLIEDLLAARPDLFVAGLAWQRCVGGGDQTSPECLRIERLFVRKCECTVSRITEEYGHAFVTSFVSKANVVVFRRMLAKHFTPSVENRSRTLRALVPNKCHPTGIPKDALELYSGRGRVEPMKCLPGGNEIDRVFEKRGRLGAALDARKAGVARKKLFSSFAHGVIGLHADDGISVVEK